MNASKRILIVTGGTGGHIYPAVALAQQITREIPDSQIAFIGGALTNNPYLIRHNFPLHSIACGAFIQKNPLEIVKSLSNIGLGIWQSLDFIRTFRPHAAVGFGSYYSFPPLVAAKLMSVPIVIHEANSIPGKVNRFLSKHAAVSAVHFPQTLKLLKGNTIEVGMPLREEMVLSSYSQKEAKQNYGLNPEMPVILVFGGSQGAQIINSIAPEAIKLAQLSHACPYSLLQIIHLAGNTASANQLQLAYTAQGIRAIVKSFEENMAMAWRAADVVIARAGAGTIAEQLEFEVPGILIPFAKAADNHQEYNADFMVENVGAAKKLREDEMSAEKLASYIMELLKIEASVAMCNAMRKYKQHSRTRDLCSIVKEVIEKKN